MASDEYKFSLADAEKQTRETVIRSYSGFTQNVYEKIPAEFKYTQAWEKATNIVTLHHNDAQKLLHSRPSSDDAQNDISLSDLYPEA